MKKYLGYFLVIAFLVTVPFMSVAKQSLTDGEMGSLTAQEGVTVDLGVYSPTTLTFGVTVNGFVPALQSWGDGDGFTGYEDSGWFGSTTTTNAMSHVGVGGQMTIDVGSSGADTAVRIGLPHAIIHTFNTNSTLKLSANKQLSDAQPALGTTYNSVFAAMINPNGNNAITISSHAGEGVDINFSPEGVPTTVLIPGYGTAGVNAYMTSSWGDSDGWGTGSGMEDAGYFGTVNMLVGDAAGLAVVLLGTMSIDVGTNGSGTTGVNIVLPVINISTDGITQPLALATSRNLATNTQMLGTSYMGTLSATITGGLTISAHGAP